MESTESKFSHLLQPIRELTKNWDIDVASELNDYLEELDEMCITFDGGRTTLNFAEAALLIQGSTCIYSKKVELLHNLVYQTLEYINDRNKKRSKQAAESEDDGAAETHTDTNEQDEFSALDTDCCDKSQSADFPTAISLAPLPLSSLIPPEAHEKSRLPLISVKGELLCSLKDFKINLFTPGLDHMINLMTSAMTSRLQPQYLHSPAERGQTGGETGDPQDATGLAAAVDDVADDFLPVEDVMEQEEHVYRHQAPREGRMIRERRQPAEDKLLRTDTPPGSAWTLNDPYSLCGEEKPLRVEKCYKVPDGLDDGGKRKRRRASPLQDFRSWFTGSFDPPVPRLKKGPTCTDLNYIYLDNLKNKLKAQRRLYRRAGVFVSEDHLRQTFMEPEEAELQRQGEEPKDLPGGDDLDSDHEAFPDDAAAPGDDFQIPECQSDELSYEELVKLQVDQLVVNSQSYTQETDLSQRVKEWERKICPKLLLQEERPVFDIHDYSEWIVSSLESVGHRKPFSSIVSGLENHLACRYLLASLQLANDQTVELDSASGLEESLDTVALTLLSTARATDRFQTLTAAEPHETRSLGSG